MSDPSVAGASAPASAASGGGGAGSGGAATNLSHIRELIIDLSDRLSRASVKAPALKELSEVSAILNDAQRDQSLVC